MGFYQWAVLKKGNVLNLQAYRTDFGHAWSRRFPLELGLYRCLGLFFLLECEHPPQWFFPPLQDFFMYFISMSFDALWSTSVSLLKNIFPKSTQLASPCLTMESLYPGWYRTILQHSLKRRVVRAFNDSGPLSKGG